MKEAYELIKKLNIHRIFIYSDHMEIQYKFGNKQIIAYGQNEEELVKNFYELYCEMFKA